MLAVLKPAGRAVPQAGDKPRVYLVYDQRDAGEQTNAGLISYNFRKEFQFDHYDPAQHTRRLSQSDGVLLVWGNADEDVCSKLFQEVFQTARRKETRGLCVFDPRDTKAEALAALRKTFGEELYVGEQFGRFDPSRLDPFFTPIRRRPPGEQP